MKRHSPIILGLLLAATLVVDAISILWYAETGPISRAAVLYDALVSGQLAIVGVWAVFAAPRMLWAWLGSIVALLAAAGISSQIGALSFAESCGLGGSFVAVLAAVLWVLKRTAFWQSLTGLTSTPWQFSLLHLLASMTAVAILIVLLRPAPLLAPQHDLGRIITLLTVGDVLVVMTTLVAWASSWHLLARAAAACGAAGTLGVIEAVCVDSGWVGNLPGISLERNLVEFVAYTTIIALVIFTWLELVPLVPHARRAASLPPAGADAS